MIARDGLCAWARPCQAAFSIKYLSLVLHCVILLAIRSTRAIPSGARSEKGFQKTRASGRSSGPRPPPRPGVSIVPRISFSLTLRFCESDFNTAPDPEDLFDEASVLARVGEIATFHLVGNAPISPLVQSVSL